MVDSGSDPKIFRANIKQAEGAWRWAVVFFVIFLVVGLFSFTYLQARQQALNLPPISQTGTYIDDFIDLVIAAIAGLVVYFAIKKNAPSKDDKISVYSDRLEIQKNGSVRIIIFENINTVVAITNQYGIIFLQIELGGEMVRIVGVADIKGLFELLSSRLPPSKVKQENFLQAIHGKGILKS